ncbi:MAG: fibronectin type III domain-containing protein [Bacteroidales bacterium]|nr:fibronectin type III domain-containing protein [Bacteroidales bacterium]
MKKLTLLLLVSMAFSLNAQQLAFPEAEGFGRFATGGRNGTVYHVTNLDDSGPGSFRDAVSQPNRIVVFDVGGVIYIDERIVINRNITIAGQTAPGEGITIYGNGIALNDNSGNSIIRYIRIRMGQNGDYGKDAIGISAGTDYIFDHVSVSWGRDGTFDINGTGIDDISIQDCIISQGINKDNHSTGGLMQSGKFSIIRTLWIDNKTRNPKGRGPIEFINSVIYNWAEHGFIMGDTEGVSECNLIGSYFIAGPSSSTGSYISGTTPSFYLYPSDNWLDGNKDGTLNGELLVSGEGDYKTATIKATPFNYPGVNNLLSAPDAVNHIIDHAGASLVRDEVDELLINQLKSFGTLGQIINTEDDNGIPGAVGTVMNGPKPADTDSDGMPDEWEDANGTNKNVNDAMTISGNGYANIENYINSLTEALPFLIPPFDIEVSGITTNSVTLTWTNDEEEADELVIEYGPSPDTFEYSMSVDGDATGATITGLQSGTTYYIRIKAVNATLESVYSEVLTAETEPEAGPPVACSSPSPADGSTIGFLNGVILTWENTTSTLGGKLYYDVYFGTSEGAMELVSSGQTGRSYSAGTLEASATYYWRVKATNDLGFHDGLTWSFTSGSSAPRRVLYIPFDETSGTVAENMAGPNDAEAINNLVPEWESGQKGNCIVFNASPVNGCLSVDHYDDLAMGTSPFTLSLWYKSTGGGREDIYLLHKGTHSAEYGTLGTGKWVGIQYKAGERFTFAIDDNAAKSDLNITDNPGQYFDGEWHHLVCMRDVPADKLKVFIDGVKIMEAADNTGDISEQAEFVIGNCNYNFDTPFPGSLDELEVYNDALTDDDIAYLYHSTAVSVPGTIPRTKTLHLFPNPFTESLKFFVPEEYAGNLSVQVFDATGRMIYSEQFENTSSQITVGGLDVLPAGIYFCRIYGNARHYTGRIVKN